MSGMHHHDNEHGHEHDHDHEPIVETETRGAGAAMGAVLAALLIERGLTTRDELRAIIERLDSRSAATAAPMIARAWTEPAFKARLLAEPKAAVAESGIDMPATELFVVENTPAVHNVVVCTLCSCYPRNLLGVPPAWYKSLAYRSRTVREPRRVLAEFGLELPDHVEVRVHDSTADLRYLVLPERPAGTEGWTAEQLAALVTRDSLIGTARARMPQGT